MIRYTFSKGMFGLTKDITLRASSYAHALVRLGKMLGMTCTLK